MRHNFALLSSLATLALAGCTFLNHFDDLKDVPVAMAGTGGTPEGGGGTGGEAGEPSTQGGKGGTGGGATGGTGGATGGSGGTGGVVDLPDGLVLVAGTASSKGVISVISPTTGKELSRISAPVKFGVVTLTYDGIADLWYAIYANAINPFAEAAKLSILQIGLDGKFTVLSTTSVPLPYSAQLIAPLRDRLLYVTSTADNPPKVSFTLINTKDPKLPLQLSGATPVAVPDNISPFGMVDNLQGMLARPNTAASAPGGTATFVMRGAIGGTSCSNGTGMPPNACTVRVLTATVDAAAKGPTLETAGATGYPIIGYVSSTQNGAAGWALQKGAGGGSDVFVFPPLDYTVANATGDMIRINPFSHAKQTEYPFPMAGPHVSNAVFDSCSNVGYAGELNITKSVYAIPTASMGVSSITPISQTVNQIAFEPFTRTIIRTFQDDTSPSIDAWYVDGTDDKPTLKARPASGKGAWAPPSDLNPSLIVVKDPPVSPCQ